MAKVTLLTCKNAQYEGNGSSRCFIWDDEIKGFGLRVYPSGQRAFVLSYRMAGKKRLYTIGDFGVWTPDQARKEARKLLVDIEHGIDPNEARTASRQQGVTFDQLREVYLTKHAVRKKSGKKDEAILKRYIPDVWSSRTLRDFSRLEMSRLHQTIGEKNGPYAANRLLALLRKMFNMGVQEGLLPDNHANPCAGIKFFPENKRERFVTPDELPKIWEAIHQEEHPYWTAYFTLSILLGARRSELLSARWVDVNLEAKTWTIPDTKSGRSHTLPVPGAAVEILRLIPRLTDSPFVFPSHGKTGHLVEPKTAWARVLGRAGINGVRIHDLRRTLGSWLAAQGESLPMIGKVLNHSQPSTTAIYARLHLDPVRAALERNTEKMLSTVNQGKGLEGTRQS
jgi:integrase